MIQGLCLQFTYEISRLQNLGVFKERFPDVPLMALTATATLSVKEDVVRALKLTRCIIFRQTFNRPNLR
jgi:bloom syndrome protein